MRKLFKGQQILSVLYILASIGMFLFSLAFMTEYSDLFGLKLPQNQEIAMFHDVILQTFNRQIFAWSLVGDRDCSDRFSGDSVLCSGSFCIGCNVAADGCLLLWRSQLDHEFTSNFCLLSGIGFSVPVSGGA